MTRHVLPERPETETPNALTSDEWAEFLRRWNQAVEECGSVDLASEAIDAIVDGTPMLAFGPKKLHGTAAASLYGQPFGFTLEDVELLATARYALGMGYGDFADIERLRSLASRIAALLPPPTP